MGLGERTRILTALVGLLLWGVPAPGAADPSDPRTTRSARSEGYIAYRARTPVVIDGKLDEPGWNDAPWTRDFVDIEGDRKPRPRFRTRAKMLWDDQYFYVAAEMEEPHVWGTLTKHDSVIFHDNDFEIFIDPDGDNHEYYELEINALNTEWDLFLTKPYRDSGVPVNAWEVPGLKTATHVIGTINDPSDRDTGWTVEFAIPWAVLAEHAHRPAPPKDGDQWRVNFSRVEWQVRTDGKATTKVPGKSEDNWVWSPQGVIDMHWPERWGYVQFSEAPAGDATFRQDPTADVRDLLMRVYQAERQYFKKHNAWTGSLADLGLDGEPAPAAASRPRIRLENGGFEASIKLDAPEGRPAETARVKSDSRLTISRDR